MHQTPLRLDAQPLTIAEVESVARHRRPVELGPTARQRMLGARSIVDRRAAGTEPLYGINTGFGSLSRVRVAADGIRAMQRNLVRSHAAGVGDLLPSDVVRAMMLLLAASLSRGRSGVRPELVERILLYLDLDLVPEVPSRGSVGASGDLAPLAHVALTLLGEGMVRSRGERVPTQLALRCRDLQPLDLEAKEGLALINGTHFMAASGALLLADLERLFDTALFAAALSIDACRATDTFLDPRLHDARCQPGQCEVARRVRAALDGSQVLPAHRENDPRVQDPYCLRALPQVLGAALDAFTYARGAIERELGAVTDNPLVFAGDGNGDILSGGNFHGMPLAIPLDAIAIAMCHVAGISERRVNWLVSAHDPQNPVPAYVSPQPGLHSGLMIAQYAAAACCNEMMTLATPASVGNVTTSAGIEDYNSMGATSALKAHRSYNLLVSVIAIEILTMTEAMEYQRPLRSGHVVERGIAAIREVVPKLVADRSPAPDIAAIERLIRAGALRAAP
ncbi:MAG: histidine ammonia-lyase [Phycisphaerae bacterium]|nr:histidine ammonia-lyase [Phycisphaerae bacterium]